MKEYLVSDEKIYESMFNAISMAVTALNTDVKDRMLELAAGENNEIAKLNLETSIKNCVDYNEKGDQLLCPDTGAPTFYIRMGDRVRPENGLSSLYRLSKQAVEDATAAFILRPNMVHPITRENTGTNTGYGSPSVTIMFDPDIDFLEVVAAPISGGSETSGTFYRMLSPMDGKKGVMKFILDCFQNSTYAGKTCPPNIIGIGIGGTSDVCMKIAKQAALLRPIGTRHPDAMIAEWELEFLDIFTSSGVGSMGMGGSSGALDVHIEIAASHISGLAVAYNAQCWIGRRKTARINPDGSIVYGDFPDWFTGKQRLNTF